MKRLKGLAARRSSFQIPKPSSDTQTPNLKKISQVVGIDSPPVFSSPRNSSSGVLDNRRSVDEHCGSAIVERKKESDEKYLGELQRRGKAAAEAKNESNEKLLVELQQVLNVPSHLNSSSLGMSSRRRSSFSSSSNLQGCSSSRPSDASSANGFAIWSADAVSQQGRNMGRPGRAIVVAFDANARDALASAVVWAFLCVLKRGDELVLLGVMDYIRGPLGYKVQVNDQTWLGPNKKQLHNEIELKKLAWSETPGLKKLCEERTVKLVVNIKLAPRPEVAVVEETLALGAAHVVLDKSLNNVHRRKYYLERLTCDVTRMRRSGGVELLRATAKQESPASPTSVIPPSDFSNRPPSGAAPALNRPSTSLYSDGEEELFTIDVHGDTKLIEEGYESDDLFSLCGDGAWRTSSVSALLHQRDGADKQSARNSTVAPHDHDPARASVDSGSRLDNQLLSLTRLQSQD